MSASTNKALSLAIVVALWAVISHYTKVELQLWPVIVGLACFLGAGSGVPALQKSALGTLSGVAWIIIYAAVTTAITSGRGGPGIVDALVLGAIMFGMVFQARVPLLSYTVGAVAGAATAMGARVVNFNGGIKVAIALAIGCVLGILAERLVDVLGRMRVVPSMSNR